MRRLVDSVLFLLVAYSVTWPLVRSVTYDTPPEEAASMAAPLAARLEAPRPLLVCGRLLPPPDRSHISIRWDERGLSAPATLAADGSFTAELPGTARTSGAATFCIVDDTGRMLATCRVDAAALAIPGVVDLGRLPE